MITKSFDSWGRNKNKHELLLEIHGPCFHAFLVLINPSWCLWGLKINYSLWEKKLADNIENTWTDSWLSVQFQSALLEMTEKSFERGHSWNVNTQKESSIFRSSGLCHASIFLLFFFFCVYSCEADRRWNFTIALLSALVPFVLSVPVVSPSTVSRLWAMLLWSPRQQ